MTQFSKPTRSVRGFSMKPTLLAAGVALLCAVLHTQAHGQAAGSAIHDPTQACTTTNLDFNSVTDVRAFQEYAETVAGLLKQEKFTELDCLADSLRVSKARFSGGAFKLHKLYYGLGTPVPGHPTEVDWHDHMEHVEHWVAQNPQSIAARIALAQSYVSYGWAARGNGYSDTVSDSGWKLFGERLDKAQEILESPAKLPSKDPEWYVVMQRVARGKDWDDAQLEKVFEEAVAHYPEFEPYYRIRVVDKLPQWGGAEGDATRFAQQAAGRVGGTAGDILYFQIATEVVCACAEAEFRHMSWTRLQKGFDALQTQYGPSLFTTNVMALMAVKSNDMVAANALFMRIGESWDPETWKTTEWFHAQKDLAAQLAPLEAHRRAVRAEAAANLAGPGGAAYKKQFDQKFASIEEPCAQKAGSDQEPFEFLVKVGKAGTVVDVNFTRPSAMAGCMAQALAAARARNEALFPVPPREDFWVPLLINPAVVNTAAK